MADHTDRWSCRPSANMADGEQFGPDEGWIA
jgi:hypothetical protein